MPHASEIAAITAGGRIAVVLVEPSEGWKDALRIHGWTGAAVFAMSERMRKSMSVADPVTERWMASARPDTARVLAVMHDRSMLLNHDSDGFAIEPGSD